VRKNTKNQKTWKVNDTYLREVWIVGSVCFVLFCFVLIGPWLFVLMIVWQMNWCGSEKINTKSKLWFVSIGQYTFEIHMHKVWMFVSTNVSFFIWSWIYFHLFSFHLFCFVLFSFFIFFLSFSLSLFLYFFISLFISKLSLVCFLFLFVYLSIHNKI